MSILDEDEANNYADWISQQESNHHWCQLPIDFRASVLKNIEHGREYRLIIARLEKQLLNEKRLNVITGSLLVISIVAQGFYMIQAVTP